MNNTETILGGRNWRCRDRVFRCGEHPLIMGILNVTPDSFSDGGRFVDADAAVARGMEMLDQGAEIIDIGGESTRPGAETVAVEVEIGRVMPVVERLCEHIRRLPGDSAAAGAVISIDTMKAEVARRAIAAGAAVINDVSACTWDPQMPEVAAETGAGVVLMHMKGNPRVMQKNPSYEDVVSEVRAYLDSRLTFLAEHGVDIECLSVDPGIGFGKDLDHNMELLRSIHLLHEFGRPVAVGVSRKSFLGRLTGRDVGARLAASIAALSYCIINGADVLRVHDVGESVDAARVVRALVGGTASVAEES